MKATIASHYYAPLSNHPDPHPHFGFDLEESATVIRSDVISLRTAKVLVLEMHHDHAFIKMLVAIVHCHPNDYFVADRTVLRVIASPKKRGEADADLGKPPRDRK